MAGADARSVITWSLTGGGQATRRCTGSTSRTSRLADGWGTCQDDAARALAQAQGLIPVAAPSPQRKQPWQYDKKLYERRNCIERLFRRLKAWRRVFARCDKLDVIFAGFITAVLFAEVFR